MSEVSSPEKISFFLFCSDDDLSSSNMSHVKSLKDVKELAVCENIQRDHVNKEDRKSSQQAC